MASPYLMTSKSLPLATLTESTYIAFEVLIHSVHFFGSYRHSEQIIKRLEGAGLGFFIKASETQQKLGTFFA